MLHSSLRTWKNPDYPEQHAQIYANLDSPNMFVVCFEDSYGGIFRDFNDMILSIEQIFPPKIASVIKSPATPLEHEPVTITAQVTEGNDPINLVVLSYKVGSSGWFELPMTLEGSGYVAQIPGEPATTEVNYKVTAFDTKGRYDVSFRIEYCCLIIQTHFAGRSSMKDSQSLGGYMCFYSHIFNRIIVEICYNFYIIFIFSANLEYVAQILFECVEERVFTPS